MARQIFQQQPLVEELVKMELAVEMVLMLVSILGLELVQQKL
jgi:hypothetical protein